MEYGQVIVNNSVSLIEYAYSYAICGVVVVVVVWGRDRGIGIVWGAHDACRVSFSFGSSVLLMWLWDMRLLWI